MEKYHKIQTVFLRDPDTKFKTLLRNQFAKPAFQYLAALPWQAHEKIDGTNIRITFSAKEATVKIQGKSDNAQIPPHLLTLLQEMFPADVFKKHFEGHPAHFITLYGEGCGAKIQKGGGNYNPDGARFILFDVWMDGVFLAQESVGDIANVMGLDVAPLIAVKPLLSIVEMVEEGLTSALGDFTMEGLVARPLTELKDNTGERIITKIKCKDFNR